MPADHDDAALRRSVVPPAAGRSLWLAAAWTGAGAAILSAVIAITVVAVLWLPVAGAGANAGSAIRAGILTFLAALHGGITVDGVPAAFVPLGLTLLVAAIAWRAGTGLADAADGLGEQSPQRLARAGLVQLASFTLASTLLAAFGALGTSHVATFRALAAAFVLFALTGGVAFVRTSPLIDGLARFGRVAPVLRTAAAGIGVYLAFGAVLVAGSLVVHHGRVELLSAQVGGGLSGVPVLLLGLLAAPNVIIGAAAYLAGPGFAIGHGSRVALFSAPHGTEPAFPVLGALPAHRGSLLVWFFAVVAVLVAAGVVASRAYRSADTWGDRIRHVGGAAAAAALLGVALAWQGGGALGPGRLSAFGASPWQLGLAFAVEFGAISVLALGARALVVGRRMDAAAPSSRRLVAVPAPASSAAPRPGQRRAAPERRPAATVPPDATAEDVTDEPDPADASIGALDAAEYAGGYDADEYVTDELPVVGEAAAETASGVADDRDRPGSVAG